MTASPAAGSDGLFTPVLLVHGWNPPGLPFGGQPDMWWKPIDHTTQPGTVPAGHTLAGDLQALSGAAVYTLDYHAVASHWFTQSGAGGGLFLEAARCLINSPAFAGHKLVVVAHSMGGLITQWAVNTDDQLRQRTSLVLTVGTPYEGSWAATAALLLADTATTVGSLDPRIARLIDLLHLLALSCAGHDAIPGCTEFNELMRGFAAVRAFAFGSSELAELKPWPAGIQVRTLAGRIVLENAAAQLFFGVPVPGELDLGDGVVDASSAGGGQNPATVAECRYTASNPRATVDGLLTLAHLKSDADQRHYLGLQEALFGGLFTTCGHLEESRLTQLTDDIRTAVAAEITRQSPTAIVRVGPVDANSRLAKGYTITKTVTGDNSIFDESCSTVSNIVGKAYRCFTTDHGVYDPCWTDTTKPTTPSVVCLLEPWSHTTVRILLSKPPAPTEGSASDPHTDEPWGVQLATGQRCIAISGSHDTYNQDVVDYSCGNDYALVLLRGINRNTPQWTIKSAYYKNGKYSPGPVASIVTAWYSQPNKY